ncbi:MAG: aminodeoxychorismate/anthranilate synthase component II [Acidobacteria bacterium]|nr:aminodeoxychorismate/anthranilate synthase component II [Acidobacteriota bacterium]
MIVIIDNYDSFTWNLAQAVGALESDVVVIRNDRFDPDETLARGPRAVIISPGPGRPENSGRSIDMIRACEKKGVPVLGVCLGHQAIGALHGAIVERAPAPRHGKSSEVRHGGDGIFSGVSDPFHAARYHSLVVREESLPPELTVTARSDDGLVMAIAHRTLPVFGVQFHPESVLTPEGDRILGNFVRGLAG